MGEIDPEVELLYKIFLVFRIGWNPLPDKSWGEWAAVSVNQLMKKYNSDE